MTDETTTPRMPGRTGWPLIGQTLAFLEDSFGFIERGVERAPNARDAAQDALSPANNHGDKTAVPDRSCAIRTRQSGLRDWRSHRAQRLDGDVGVYSTNLYAGIYSEPTKFDPSRFSNERAEHKKHEHAFSPQGPGKPEGHRCPGLDFSTVFMSTFLIHLVRGYSWEIPPQNVDYRWSMIPPEPKDGLRVRFSRASH